MCKGTGFQIKTSASQHHMCKGTGVSNQDIGKPTSYVQRYRGFKSRHRQANIICAKVPGFQIKTSASQHHMCKGTGVSNQDTGKPTSYVQRYRAFKSRHRQANIICAKVPGFQIKTSASQHHMCKGTGVSNQDIGKPTSYVQRYRGFIGSLENGCRKMSEALPGILQIKISSSFHWRMVV